MPHWQPPPATQQQLLPRSLRHCRRPRRGRPLRRAGGRDRRDERHGHRPRDHRLHAAAEASGRAPPAERRAVRRVHAAGAANAITVRYSIPDAPTGGGITAPLDVTSTAAPRQTMTLTSQYAWLYNQYPFSNDPNAGLLHPDWWITECACVPDRDDAGAGGHQAVPAEPLLRRAAAAARPTYRPATRCG